MGQTPISGMPKMVPITQFNMDKSDPKLLEQLMESCKTLAPGRFILHRMGPVWLLVTRSYNPGPFGYVDPKDASGPILVGMVDPEKVDSIKKQIDFIEKANIDGEKGWSDSLTVLKGLLIGGAVVAVVLIAGKVYYYFK